MREALPLRAAREIGIGVVGLGDQAEVGGEGVKGFVVCCGKGLGEEIGNGSVEEVRGSG